MAVRRLPLVTIGIAALCIVFFALTYVKIVDEEVQLPMSYVKVIQQYYKTPYLELPDDFAAECPKTFQKVYDVHREWMAEYEQNARELAAQLGTVSQKGTTGSSRRAHNDFETVTELMNPSSTGETEKPNISAPTDEDAKFRFFRQYRDATPDSRAIARDQLDEQLDQFYRFQKSAISLRFGYVPKHPKPFSVITYQFLHGGIFHILMNLFLLWLVAPQLEDQWGRKVFPAFYLACGICGAWMHHLTHMDSAIPVIGASGAVAGVMGAFAFRFGRSRIHFFYMYFALKLTPKTGTFEAPAHVMIGIWFIGQVLYALVADFGATAYWAHVGGFLFGLGTAVVFRFTDFERKVLGVEPIEILPIENVPLVAFTALPKDVPMAPQTGASTAPTVPDAVNLNPVLQAPQIQQRYRTGRHPRELFIEKMDRSGLYVRSLGQTHLIPFDEIEAVAPGRIDRVGTDGVEVFHGGIPKDPAFLVALFPLASTPLGKFVFVVNAAQCRWAEILPVPQQSAAANMIAFIKLLLQRHSSIRYIHGPGPVGAHNMPIYDSFGGFLRHLQKRTVA